MVENQSKLRTGPRNFHDDVFENEVNDLINITKSHYDAYVPSPSQATPNLTDAAL